MAASADRDVGDVSAVVAGDAGAIGARSGQSIVGAGGAVSNGGGGGAGYRAGDEWVVERKGGRAAGVSAGTGVLVRATGQLRAKGLEPGDGSGPVSAGDLYVSVSQ